MASDENPLEAERREIEAALRGGLPTDWEQRAYEDGDVRRVVAALQAVAPDDLAAKLRIAGFTLTPYVHPEDTDIEQACHTCMYYEPHRRYCNLPELKLGVEPQWSCILWRI
jgi:hypothetical protein